VSADGGRLRRRLGLALRYGVAVCLIAWIIHSGDWDRIRKAILAVRLRDFILSYLLLLAAWGIVVMRLQGLLTWTPIRKSWLQLYRIQLVSHFVGFVAPSDIGMAVARWFMVTENRTGRGVFLLVTLQERLLMTATAAVLCVPALLAARGSLPQHVAGRIVSLALAILAGSLIMLTVLSRGFSAGWGRKWYLWLGRFAGFGSAVENKNAAGPGPEVAWGRVLGTAALLTAVFLAVMALRVWVLTRSLGVSIEARDLFWMVMCMMLFLTLPFSIGGIGLRELGYGALFHWVGADTERGVVLGLLLSSQILLNAFVGGVLALQAGKAAKSPDVR